MEAVVMLMRTDPFRELDRLTPQLFDATGTATRPAVMPMDAYRSGNDYVVQFDLPGVSPDSIDLDVERNVLPSRPNAAPSSARTPRCSWPNARGGGVFSRQLFLGETLDADHIEARYDAGVLTLRVPITEQAKPRKIAISPGSAPKQINA